MVRPPGSGHPHLPALLLVANIGMFKQTDTPDTGVTTEMAALAMYGVGAILAMGYLAPAPVLGGVVAVLLHSKEPLYHMTERIGDKDIEALIRLSIIALVILPILPDRDFGPFHVLNPFEIWLKAAIIFGGLYAAVLLAVAFAREFMGPSGLCVVAGISGLTDIDAITLSTAQLMKSGGLDPSTGWRVVQVGALSNLVFKGGVVV